jgi:hypothetical protein
MKACILDIERHIKDLGGKIVFATIAKFQVPRTILHTYDIDIFFLFMVQMSGIPAIK